MQSRQYVTEQTLARPFFASSSQNPQFASYTRRVSDMIFDSLAPHTPAAQRDQFMSLLAPFAVVGAAFVVHANMDPRWRIPSLWSVIVALVVKVLWLQSSLPVAAEFGHGNAIILIDFFGECITVPFQLCSSYKVGSLLPSLSLEVIHA